MSRVADPLRAYAHGHTLREGDVECFDPRTSPSRIVELADAIDAEHENRMAQCRRETKRAALRYLRSVMEDYFRHDVKRRRRDG